MFQSKELQFFSKELESKSLQESITLKESYNLLQDKFKDIIEQNNLNEKKDELFDSIIKNRRNYVVAESIKYFNGDELAGNVFINKYAIKDSMGFVYETTPDDMHRRLAKELARIESKYENSLTEGEIFDLIKNFKYIVPQGSPMAGIGNTKQYVSLSNCFVVGNPDGQQDSYGAIFKIDEKIAQLQKRRCVSENTNVYVKGKGLIQIKDVQIGDYVYSFNLKTNTQEFNKVLNKFETFVKKENRITYETANGTILETSRLHPILIDDNGYKWVSDASINSNAIRPIKNNDFFVQNSTDSKLELAAWFAGAHLGDGSADYELAADDTLSSRLRMTGDNKEVIDAYCNAITVLCGSCVDSKKSNRKDYVTQCWSCECRSKSNTKLITNYLDGTYGNKTYFSKIPTFVQNNINTLFIPFLAGLIDTDGHVDHTGRISIELANKKLIDELCSILSLFGIRYSFRKRNQKNKKTKKTTKCYKLSISNQLNYEISKFLNHNIKRNILTSKPLNIKEYSSKFFLEDYEFNSIIEKYNNLDTKLINSNLRSCINHLVKLTNKGVGIGLINELLNNKLIDEDTKNRIIKRQNIDNKLDYTESTKFIDIEVENVNNFYAGNFGLILIHNCGVGTDIAGIRPAGTKVNNAAITSTGKIPFAERYSNTTREVAQDGRRGALMITTSIRHPEAEKFIDSKLDLSKITGANISLKIHDDFMEAMLANADYKQQWPIYSKNPEIVTTTNASKLWNKIIHNAWKSAEPGVLYWDRIIEESPADIYKKFGFETVSTNPCLAGDSKILTDKGQITIKDLVEKFNNGESFNVLTYNEKTKTNEMKKVENAFLTKKKAQLIELELENGEFLKLTPDHKVFTENRGWVEAAQLNSDDILLNI